MLIRTYGAETTQAIRALFGRIVDEDAEFRRPALADPPMLKIIAELSADRHVWGSTWSLADQLRLTSYDAAYLEPARPRALPPATAAITAVPGGSPASRGGAPRGSVRRMANSAKSRRAAPAPAPTAETLHDAALSYLARYATTRAALTRLLEQRIDRWARESTEIDPDRTPLLAEQARAAVAGVVARLAEAGAIDDATFAATRARGLSQSGRSRRAISAHLAQRGVGAEDARAALPADEDAELAAAVATARRRRVGPFRREPVDAAGARRELAVLARAGFSQPVAAAALRMDRDAAETLILRLRQR